MTKDDGAYQSAVGGRQDFRQAYRDARAEIARLQEMVRTACGHVEALKETSSAPLTRMRAESFVHSDDVQKVVNDEPSKGS